MAKNLEKIKKDVIDDDIYVILCDLKTILKAKKISHTKLSELTGVSRTSISLIFSMRKYPNLTTIVKIAVIAGSKIRILPEH